MQIIVGADVVSTDSNKALFEAGDVRTLVGDTIFEILQSSDGSIFNIEGPLFEGENPITKCGPCLKMSPKSINGIKQLKPSVVTLSNNHIMDHGIDGLKNTINCLNNAEVPFIGAGMNLEEASKCYVIEKDGIRIGVYSAAEHEFSIADNKHAGANPFDPLESFDHISNLKNETDFVVVLYHGGREYYRYPSPYIQRVFKKMVDKGADIVVAQHTHCIGAFEEYNGALLVYGQGNFIFDGGNNEYWNSGILVKLDITKSNFAYSFIPFAKNGGCIRAVEEKNIDYFLNDFYERSNNIKSSEFVNNTYDNYCRSSIDSYFSFIHGSKETLLFRVINKISRNHLVSNMYSLKQKNSLLNVIECEAHREIIINGLKKRILDK